jgi:hypothetical protein
MAGAIGTWSGRIIESAIQVRALAKLNLIPVGVLLRNASQISKPGPHDR